MTSIGNRNEANQVQGYSVEPPLDTDAWLETRQATEFSTRQYSTSWNHTMLAYDRQYVPYHDRMQFGTAHAPRQMMPILGHSHKPSEKLPGPMTRSEILGYNQSWLTYLESDISMQGPEWVDFDWQSCYIHPTQGSGTLNKDYKKTIVVYYKSDLYHSSQFWK